LSMMFLPPFFADEDFLAILFPVLFSISSTSKEGNNLPDI
jgi:hypothetical protein